MGNIIRFVREEDCRQILNIYSYYIENTAVSFETEVPNCEKFEERIKNISSLYPYLVYEKDNKIIGYAYASRYAEREAYRYSVTLSVYVLEKYHGKGIAKQLYDVLFNILLEQGFYNVYACITLPNEKSINFHKKFGFREVGVYNNVGYKLNKWHDVIYMEKMLKTHNDVPMDLKSIKELPEEVILNILKEY